MNANIPAVGAPSREPIQVRSRESFERMLAAAEELLAERGNDEFTLIEVGKRGRVSIGSIYGRFDSKDDLIRAVQSRVLATVETEQMLIIDRIEAESTNLFELITRLVDGTAESLRQHAAIMRPLMRLATDDPVVAAVGKASYQRVAERVHTVLLMHKGEIRQHDVNRAVQSSYRVMYAAIARYLGFGSDTDAAWEGDWTILKEDVGRMCAAFLLSDFSKTPPSDN